MSRQKVSTRIPLTAWPAMIWMAIFLVIPVGIVGIYSFLSRGPYGGIVWEWTTQNFVRVFDGLYLRIFWDSFVLASITSASCLVIGYPMAYVMATVSRRWRSILMILLVIPFWTNFVVRTYALKVLVGEQGPLSQWLMQLGWIDEPLAISNSYAMVLFGMITNYLPFMVLPLYVAIDKFDFNLLEAGRDLGASSWNNFWKVLLPLTKSGVITGSILVFTPALGEFLIPDLLGGARMMFLGNLITEQFLKMRDWPFGAALSLLLMTVVTASMIVVIHFWMKEDVRGREL